jgi:hypothetical protein
MKPKDHRMSASAVRKYLPHLRRITTPEGRKWAAGDGKVFDTLEEVIQTYLAPHHEMLAEPKVEVNPDDHGGPIEVDPGHP